jgi:hypothetical protein
MNSSRRCCTSWTNVLGRWTNKQKLIREHDKHVGIPSFTDWVRQFHKHSLQKVCFIEEVEQGHASRCNMKCTSSKYNSCYILELLATATVHVTSWDFLELLQLILYVGSATAHVTSWNFLELLQFMLHLGTHSSCYILELLQFMLHITTAHLGTATLHVTSWNFLELLQFILHLGMSWNCYILGYILEFLRTATVHVTSSNFLELLQFMLDLWTPTVHLTSLNCYSSCYILELLQFMLHIGTPTFHVTYWNGYSSCYILELHILELLQFVLHLEGRVTSSLTTPGERV